jgi:YbbR domain-containing protein
MFVGGPKRDLEQVDHVEGRVDLTDYKPGRTYPVALKAMDKDGLEIKTVNLEATSVIYTPTLSIAAPEKSVLIDVVFKPGTRPAPGYRLSAFSTLDLAVTVQGPTSVIGGIKVVKTAPIDLSNLKATQQRKVPLLSPDGTKLSSPNVTVELVIEKVSGISGANP